MDKIPNILAGQFLYLDIPSRNATLRRPFCIFDWDDSSLTLVIEIKGGGTKALLDLSAGQTLKAIMPIGNGFYLEEEWKRVVLIGGGIGCAPLFGISKTYSDKEYFSILGFKSQKHIMLKDSFESFSRTEICTYDGSYGRKGYQISILLERLDELMPQAIIACGSNTLLKSVKEFCMTHGIKGYASIEQRMACGVGACLGCTCKVKNENGEIKNRRVCVDGPIFDLLDLEL